MFCRLQGLHVVLLMMSEFYRYSHGNYFTLPQLRFLHFSVSYCNVQPSQSKANRVDGKACSSTKGGLPRYTQRLLDSHSFEFEICISQALNMPLIRCTNVFFQGRLSRHITSPSEKTRPESWPEENMGMATPVWQLSLSHRCHQM